MVLGPWEFLDLFRESLRSNYFYSIFRDIIFRFLCINICTDVAKATAGKTIGILVLIKAVALDGTSGQ